MKHKVGYAVYFKGILDSKFTLDRIYLNYKTAVERIETLFQMFGYEGKIEKTWIMED